MSEQHNTPNQFDSASIESDRSDPNLTIATDSTGVAVQIQKLAERKREITARIQIPNPVEQVWQVLTNYEALAEFIPNMAKSKLLDHPQGGIRLEQIGSQRLLRFNFSARVVLDLEEIFPHQIRFHMVEGDFKEFFGSWKLETLRAQEQILTDLCYTVNILPKRTMPVGIIERRLSKDLETNLVAIRQQVAKIS